MTIAFTTTWSPEMAERVFRGYSHNPAIHYQTWDTARGELMRVVQNRGGADVSMIGDTWISSFVGMNALRPFRPTEIDRLGGAGAFLPAFWQMGTMPGDDRVWSIPNTVGSRYVLYRQDLLERAGIDPATAFINVEVFEQTIQRLQEVGGCIPLVVSPRGGDLFFKTAAWLRALGGDYADVYRKRVTFDDPLAQAGLAAFFRLYRYMTSEVMVDHERHFIEGKAAVAISGSWVYDVARVQMPPELLPHVRLAPPPGVPFVGGAHLVIWAHSVHEEDALDLIRYLNSRAATDVICSGYESFPSSLATLGAPPFTTDPIYAAIAETLHKGRGFWAWPLGSLMQERLSSMLDRLALDVIEHPDADVADCVARHVTPLARMLNRTLGGQG
jgi:multiple sugar transport system substrate-binding protein